MVEPAFADAAQLAGRVVYGTVLAFMASSHFLKTKDMAGYAAMKKVPAPRAAVLASGAALFAGAVSILFGVWVDWGVLLVTLFFVPVTLTMHSFWADTDPMMKMNNRIGFQKNLVMLGAAWMFLAIPQPWAYSLG